VHRLSTSFVLGYHGCSEEAAKALLAGTDFTPSQNDYDWLGHGIYFWQSNPLRALEFATETKKRQPTVVGAVINPGLCLDLATSSGIVEVRKAHQSLTSQYEAAASPLPKNSGGEDRFARRLDCQLLEMLHDIRKHNEERPIDTVFGIFFEGQPIYQDAGFYEKTHIQICVRNPTCIVGVFRVSDPQAAANVGSVQ
jgi:hypothetical protein